MILTPNMQAATIALCRYVLAHGTTMKEARVIAEALRRTIGDTPPPPRVNDQEPRRRLSELVEKLTGKPVLTVVKEN